MDDELVFFFWRGGQAGRRVWELGPGNPKKRKKDRSRDGWSVFHYLILG